MSGYMIEMQSEERDEITEYAEDMLEICGKLVRCLKKLGDESGSMGQRMGYRRGVRGTGRYGMRSGMGYRNDGMGYRDESDEPNEGMSRGMVGYRDPYYNN